MPTTYFVVVIEVDSYFFKVIGSFNVYFTEVALALFCIGWPPLIGSRSPCLTSFYVFCSSAAFCFSFEPSAGIEAVLGTF